LNRKGSSDRCPEADRSPRLRRKNAGEFDASGNYDDLSDRHGRACPGLSRPSTSLSLAVIASCGPAWRPIDLDETWAIPHPDQDNGVVGATLVLTRHPEALARRSRGASLEGRTTCQLHGRAASFEAHASLGHLRMTAWGPETHRPPSFRGVSPPFLPRRVATKQSMLCHPTGSSPSARNDGDVDARDKRGHDESALDAAGMRRFQRAPGHAKVCRYWRQLV
jgi:hypothetical protein